MSDDLFFVIARLFWVIFNPLTVLLSCIVIGTALLWISARLAKSLILIGVMSLLIASSMPLGKVILTPLETRFSQPHRLPDTVTGIIVLGGAFNLKLSRKLNYPVLSNYGRRLFTAMNLWNRYPGAKFFFSGFDGSLSNEKIGEADIAYLFFNQHNLADQVYYEKYARNTYENALYLNLLAQPKVGENWLLVTSAFHMPRSVGVFRQAGWDVIPIPTRNDHAEFSVGFPSWYNLLAANHAIREWVGLLAYSMTGKTDSLFPAP